MSSLIMNFFHSDFGNSGNEGIIINPDTLVNSDYKYKLVIDPSGKKVINLVDNATYTASTYIDTVGALGETRRVISVLNYNTFKEINTKFTNSHTEPEFTVSFWVLTSIDKSAIVWGGKRFYIVLYYLDSSHSYDYPYIIDATNNNYAAFADNYPCYLKNLDYTGKVKKNDWNWVCLTKKDGIGRFWINGDFQGKFDYPTYALGETVVGLNPLCGNRTDGNTERVYFDDYCVLNKALYTVDKNIPVPTQYFPWNE